MMQHHGEPLNDPHPRVERARNIKEKATIKTKQFLGLGADEGEEEHQQGPYEDAVRELNNSLTFNKTSRHVDVKDIANKAMDAMRATGYAIVHPKDAAKSRATKAAYGKLAKKWPHKSRQADLEFLEAHDDLARARNSTDEEQGEQKPGEAIQFEEKIERMEKQREEARVAWITARHVQRVRVVDSRRPQFPDAEFFEVKDDCGYPKFKWDKWVAYKLLQHTNCFTAQYVDNFEELPSDLDTLRRHLERLAVVSAPAQTFLFEIRRVYRWEEPFRTVEYMTFYWSLWYISHLMTFFYGYTFYCIAKNYFFPTSVQTLREGIKRSFESGEKAFKIGELMDQGGNDDWLKPLMDELGPYLQLQIVDLASFLEMLYNFYHFRSPRDTVATLVLFATLFLLTAFTDSEFAMKVFWAVVGLIFFICWPISSLYPRYRLLVSPFRWGFWDIPNHAESSFRYLQERSAVVLQAIDQHDYEEEEFHDAVESVDSFQTAQLHPQEISDRDILAFACTYHHHPGQLILSRNTLCFKPSCLTNHSSFLPSTFEHPYISLIEMSKHENSSFLSPVAKVTMGSDQLELTFRRNSPGNGILRMDREEEVDVVMLGSVRDRDKAFNALIGFSGLRWQHLQKRASGKKLG